MYYVYLLQNVERQDEFYLGYSADLKRRFAEHNASENRSTSGRQWRVVYYEAYLTEEAARDREARLKRHSRVKRFLMDRVRKHLGLSDDQSH